MGLGLFRRLAEDHGIIGCSTYNPLVDPTKRPKDTDLTPAVFQGLTAYKNRLTNAHIRSTTVEVRGFRGADSLHGITFLRNMLDGYQLLEDAVIVGQSPNKGAAKRVKVSKH